MKRVKWKLMECMHSCAIDILKLLPGYYANLEICW